MASNRKLPVAANSTPAATYRPRSPMRVVMNACAAATLSPVPPPMPDERPRERTDQLPGDRAGSAGRDATTSSSMAATNTSSSGTRRPPARGLGHGRVRHDRRSHDAGSGPASSRANPVAPRAARGQAPHADRRLRPGRPRRSRRARDRRATQWHRARSIRRRGAAGARGRRQRRGERRGGATRIIPSASAASR